jgi:hypothetical protein
MNRIKVGFIAFMISIGGMLALPAYASAQSVISPEACKSNAASNPLCKSQNAGSQNDLNKQITTITNVILFILGVAAVIVIIIGGLMYVVSAGDPGKAKTAKDTILYAVIGLVVALFAGAIVNFVVTRIG